MDKKNLYLLVFCFFFGFVKLISILLTDFNLFGDEAQYWYWSKDLSFGYFSKPPLLAWLIGFITYFFGDSFFILKSIPVFIYFVTSYSIFVFTKGLFKNETLAVCCATTFFLLPSVSVSSFLLSTDCILVLFWTLSLNQVLKIRNDPSYLNFFIFGFVVGFAFLAKYAAIYFIISFVVFLIFETSTRAHFLKNKAKFLFSFLVLAIILTPNIVWNYNNSWITLDHTVNNASLDEIQINFPGLLEFLASQLLMVGPVLFLGFLFCLKKHYKLGYNEKLLLCFAFPAILLVSVESLLVRAHANWAAVSLISFTIFFVSILYNFNKKIIYINNYLNLLFGLALFAMIATSQPFGFFDRIKGLKNFIYFLDNSNAGNSQNIVVVDRLLLSNLIYEYRSTKTNFFSPHAPRSDISNHFQLKIPLLSNFSKNFLLVGEINEIGYLINSHKSKLVGSGSFPFSSKDIQIYEVIFE